MLEWLEMKGVPQCASGVIAFTLTVFFIIPACIVLGAIVAVFVTVFGIIPIYFYSYAYLFKLIGL